MSDHDDKPNIIPIPEEISDRVGEVPRDERWEKVWARIGRLEPFGAAYEELLEANQDPDDWFEVRFEVDYDGRHYWQAQRFHKEDFDLSDLAIWKYLLNEMVTIMDDQLSPDNLKTDFIYYVPGVDKSRVVCTCEKFDERDNSSESGLERLSKKALLHHQKTGHTISPRGN